MAVAADRPAQRGRDLGRRGGRVDQGLVTSRKPDDLEAFCAKPSRSSCEGVARRAGAQRVSGSAPAAILDVDGTLVDTNYQHAIAWFRAFRQHGVVLPLWRIHRHIGMGGDQLVAALAGEEFDAEHGDDVRAAEKALYMALIDEVAAARGRPRADRRRCTTAGTPSCSPPRPSPTRSTTTSSCSTRATCVDGWTTSADVEATKPEPDLVAAAVEKAGGGKAVMVGDSTWDCEAAKRAGVKTIGVLTGGFSETRAARRRRDVRVRARSLELRRNLAQTPLG